MWEGGPRVQGGGPFKRYLGPDPHLRVLDLNLVDVPDIFNFSSPRGGGRGSPRRQARGRGSGRFLLKIPGGGCWGRGFPGGLFGEFGPRGPGPKINKNSRFRARLKISSGIDIFERATHRGHIFCGGNQDVEIENFERD